MRKDKEQQKNALDEQLELFSRTGEPVRATTGRTDENPSAGDELFSRLERQRTLTENLLEKIVDYENLKRAYKQVKEK